MRSDFSRKAVSLRFTLPIDPNRQITTVYTKNIER